ncbi:ATP-binding protein [Parafrankia sp. FMc2]|uniref:ATP-binding protein n=1 Tax=Parafrankia sp. FMc2 TaxID=3233196 RepID=UPI0034D765C3
MTDLSPLLATRVAHRVVSDFLRDAPPGRCLRLDHLRVADCHAVRDAALAALAETAETAETVGTAETATAGGCVVAVLGADASAADAVVSPERAIELRNRKSTALLLLVPAGTDSPAASSLDNSFESIDIEELFAKIVRDALQQLDRPLRDLFAEVQATARGTAFPRSRQARAEYLLAVGATAADPVAGGLAAAKHVAGTHLYLFGLIPDQGGASFVSRLPANAQCVKELVKPARSQTDARTRLTDCPLRQDAERYREIERYLVALPRLSERAWLRDLAADDNADLAFNRWPLDLPTDSDLTALQVEPFANAEGIIAASTGLRAGADGGAPTCSARGGFVKITWTTEPVKPKDVARWQVEIIPSEEFYGAETDFDVTLPAAKVAGSKHSHRLTVNVDTEGAERVPALVTVRVSALDRNNQVLRLRDGNLAQATSKEFALDDAPPPESTATRRDTAVSLPVARLRAEQAGADTDIETSEGWQTADLAYLQLRFGRGGKTQLTRIGVSAPLRDLSARVLAEPDTVGRYEADVGAGQLFAAAKATAAGPDWPAGAGRAFLGARRDFFEAVRAQPGRGLLEVATISDELAALGAKYTAAYGRILRRDSGTTDLRVLTSIDTLRLRIRLGRRHPVDALIMLPTHPLRVAWYLGYHAELEQWRTKLRTLAAKDRRDDADLDLLATLSPARLPFLLAGADGAPYVFAQNLRLLYGLYLPVDEADPATAVSETVTVLGLPSADASIGEVPPARLADRIRLYRNTHRSPERLRILATNPGSGEFLGEALRVVTADTGDPADVGDTAGTGTGTVRELGEDEAVTAPHIWIEVFGEGASETNPLPGLRQLQRDIADNRTHTRPGRGLLDRGFLDPALEISAAPLDAIEAARDAHLAVLADVSRPQLHMSVAESSGGSVSFRGLITQLVTRRDPAELAWDVGIEFPTARGADSTPVTDLHRRFAETVSSLFTADGDETTTGDRAAHSADPADLTRDDRAVRTARIRVQVDGDTRRVLDLAHDRCDWVVVLDRFLGLDLFDDPSRRAFDGRRYILDYAPEFLDGLGHQLAITTAHRADVEKMFLQAMTELGFDRPGESVSSVVDELLLVSGRLILAATGNDKRAKEAVALAAVVSHLRRRGELADTIVIPIDAHLDLFGPRAHRGGSYGEKARRCDLLLVRFPGRRLHIEAVEVKSRGMLDSEDLARGIDAQVRASIDVVRRLFFADPARIDQPLQRTRLATLLRYYLRRAARRGLVTNAVTFGRMQEGIDRLDIADPSVSYQQSGYILVQQGDGVDEFTMGETRIHTLTAATLGVETPAADIPAPTAGIPALTAGIPALTAGIPAPDTDGTAATVVRRRRDIPRQPAGQPPAAKLPEPAGLPEPLELPESPEVSGASPVAGETSSPTLTPDTGGVSVRRAPSGAPEVVRVPVGRTLPPEEDVVWEAATIGSPHLFILGIPGQGKSETTIRLLQGAAEGGLPALVIDFHGQFSSDPRRPQSLRVQDAAAGLPFSPFELTETGGRHAYKMNALSISEIFAYVCGLGDIQRDVVYQALISRYEAHGHGQLTPSQGIPTLDEVRDAIVALEKERGVANVLARCRPLLEYGLFTDNTGETAQDLIRDGLVVDLHGFAEVEQAQVAAGAFLLRKIYKDMFTWGQTGELRLAIVLDEAHRLARDATLPRLMKEGRKFGVAVIVASQGLDDFHPDVLANAGTKIIYRINYPQSRKAAGFLRTRTSKDLSEELEQLPVGNAYVQTPNMAVARRTRMLRPEA